MRRLFLLCLLASSGALAAEGMWLFNDFPAAKVQQELGVSVDAGWLDAVRLSSVRLAGGCSASFVSGRGLVMTNHHCIRSCIEDLADAKHDLLADGFYAPQEKDERRCPKVEANQLLGIDDVTAKIRAATAGKEGAPFHDALKAETARLEAQCATAPSLRCEVVTLFHGGRYDLYRYRRFQDVRLVFAPEFPMAAFGGDPDNFSFPRYGFDVAFLRVYDAESPAATPEHLRWAQRPIAEGEPVFVSGHPGGTERLSTVAQLVHQRDVALPTTLLRLAELRGLLVQFGRVSPEQFRISRAKLRSVENSLKALRGRQQFLAEPAFLEGRRAQEAAFRKRLAANPALQQKYGAAWDDLAKALERFRGFQLEYRMKEGSDAFSSELFAHARTLVRAAEELPKPNEQRLEEFGEAHLPAVVQQLSRAAPVDLPVEELTLAFGLGRLREQLGADDPFVKETLGGQAPEELARALLRGTRLQDAAVRQALYKGGKEAIAASKDPLILFARKMDAAARAVRKKYEDEVESVEKRAGEQIAQAHLALEGTSGYPDATFSLRLSYGQVQGWTEGGREIPALTRFSGLFERHTGKYPFALAPKWLAARGALDPKTPMDLATTNDIIGGNSGSPLLNRDGEAVGIIFDGNLPSLGGRYGYVPATNRAVALHGSAILAALEHVYGARRLLAELGRPLAKAP